MTTRKSFETGRRGYWHKFCSYMQDIETAMMEIRPPPVERHSYPVRLTALGTHLLVVNRAFPKRIWDGGYLDLTSYITNRHREPCREQNQYVARWHRYLRPHRIATRIFSQLNRSSSAAVYARQLRQKCTQGLRAIMAFTADLATMMVSSRRCGSQAALTSHARNI